MKKLPAVFAAASAMMIAQPTNAADFIQYRMLVVGSVLQGPNETFVGRLTGTLEFNMPVSALTETNYTYNVGYVPNSSPLIRDEIRVVGPRIYIASLFQQMPGGPSRTANISFCGGFSGVFPTVIYGVRTTCSPAIVSQYPGDPTGTPSVTWAATVVDASATLLDGAPSRFGLVGVPNFAVPEPGTWALMLVGFGMIGSAIRYRRRTVRTVFAR